MSSIFAGSFSRNGPFTSLSEILYSVIAASSLPLASAFQISGLRQFVGGETFRLGEGFQGLLGIFAELAVDLPWRKSGPVEQDLDLDDGGINSVVGRTLGRILGVVDGRSIKAGGQRPETAASPTGRSRRTSGSIRQPPARVRIIKSFGAREFRRRRRINRRPWSCMPRCNATGRPSGLLRPLHHRLLSASLRLCAVLISAIWVSACGKLPVWRRCA